MAGSRNTRKTIRTDIPTGHRTISPSFWRLCALLCDAQHRQKAGSGADEDAAALVAADDRFRGLVLDVVQLGRRQLHVAAVARSVHEAGDADATVLGPQLLVQAHDARLDAGGGGVSLAL